MVVKTVHNNLNDQIAFFRSEKAHGNLLKRGTSTWCQIIRFGLLQYFFRLSAVIPDSGIVKIPKELLISIHSVHRSVVVIVTAVALL